MTKLVIPPMRIPVFVSAPSPENLSPDQEQSAIVINELLARYKLEWRALGRSDYSTELPLQQVVRMVKHCAGGIILGFEQFRADDGEVKRGSPKAKKVTGVAFPTPWNQLEAGILYSAGLPLMIFREADVSGGVFDVGTSETFIHSMPTAGIAEPDLNELDAAFQNWVARVRAHYYGG